MIKDSHISGEFIVYRFENGIKVSSPENRKKIKYGHAINSLMNLDFPVYLEDSSHISIKSNEATAKACGFSSLKDFIGKPPFKYFKKDTILEKITNHQKVIRKGAFVIAEETALRTDGDMLNTLSIRMPWYDDNGRVVGLFGSSIVLGVNPLAETLKEISSLGFLNSVGFSRAITKSIGVEIDSIYLSKRELECLRLTVLGKPAKQVAFELNLSQRTVEEYLDNVKRKMKVSSKAALIEKAVEDYFVFKE